MAEGVSWNAQRWTTARDPEAYDSDPALLREDWRTAYQHAYSKVGNKADAEDLAQETFLKLFQYRSRVKAYVGWMKAVVRSIRREEFAKTRPDLRIGIDDKINDLRDGLDGDDHEQPRAQLAFVDPGESAEQKVVHQSLAQEALAILGKSSYIEKECVMMYASGYTFVQIAATLGIQYWEAISITKKTVVAIRKKISR